MAKKSKIAAELRRQQVVERYAERRAEYPTNSKPPATYTAEPRERSTASRASDDPNYSFLPNSDSGSDTALGTCTAPSGFRLSNHSPAIRSFISRYASDSVDASHEMTPAIGPIAATAMLSTDMSSITPARYRAQFIQELVRANKWSFPIRRRSRQMRPCTIIAIMTTTITASSM